MKQRRSFGSPRLERVLHGLSGRSVQKHFIARIFSAHSRTVRWHAFLSLLRSTPFSSATLTLGFTLVRTGWVVGRCCSTGPLKIPLVRVPHRPTVQTHLRLALLRFAHEGRHTLLLERKDARRCCATDCPSCCAPRHICNCTTRT